MTGYWWYILKVSLCIIVFYIFYILVLRKCTFFVLNRLSLVFGLLLSFIIPILEFSFFNGASDGALSTIVYPFLSDPDAGFLQPRTTPDHITTLNFSMFLPMIYFTGVFVLFFRLLFSSVRIIRIINHSETSRIGRYKIARVDSNSPFSFFHLIFLPKGENNPLIMEHEMAHVRQLHWVDLILVEAASVLLWFNPFIFFYKRSLKLQHEYLADTSVLKDYSRMEGYLTCMLKQVQVVNLGGIVSQFYCKTIKKRIIMMTKDKTSHKYLGVYVLLLPLVCLLLTAFSPDKEDFTEDSGVVLNHVVLEPSIYPLDIKKVRRTAGYGEWTNPLTKKKGFHYGMDFAVAEGEEVVATADGVVVEATFDPAKGNYVMIRHSDIFSTFYSHLKSVSVQTGDKLGKGQLIGYSGNTGTSTTGPHLHYEVLKEGERVNPEDYLPQ